jgi:hypothetical protein
VWLGECEQERKFGPVRELVAAQHGERIDVEHRQQLLVGEAEPLLQQLRRAQQEGEPSLRRPMSVLRRRGVTPLLLIAGLALFISVGADALYDLVGPGHRTIPAELEIDDFTDKINRVHAQGRTYVTYDNTSKGILFLLVPLALLGLACVAITWTGLSGDDFDAGQGELFARYAHFDATGYHEGASVHIDAFARDAKVESRSLFALLDSPEDRLSVRVSEDSARKIAGVTYRGRTYDTQSTEWLGLLLFVPLGLFGAWGAWLNGQELRRARSG